MNQIKVESQWNGQDELMLNIPHFPHLHSGLGDNFEDYQRYPHPLEYFFVALNGTITLVIKNFAQKNNIIIKNLYITTTGEVNSLTGHFNNIALDLRLDSSASPQKLTNLQQNLLQDEAIFALIKQPHMLTINWE